MPRPKGAIHQHTYIALDMQLNEHKTNVRSRWEIRSSTVCAHKQAEGGYYKDTTKNSTTSESVLKKINNIEKAFSQIGALNDRKHKLLISERRKIGITIDLTCTRKKIRSYH